MKKTLTVLLALLAFLPGMLSAATVAPAVVLVFAGDDPGLITIKDNNGKLQVANEGMKLQANWVLTTAKGGSAELQIVPNGSIIKISAGTTFKINDLKSDDNAKSKNDFEVAAGKIRAVAAKLAGSDNSPGYTLKTPTANCGVRGTDFVLYIPEDGSEESLIVQEGLVDFSKDDGTPTIQVATGEKANAKDPEFKPAKFDPAEVADLFSDLDFVKLDPKKVKEFDAKPVTQEAEPKAEEPKKEDKPAAPAAEDPMMAWIKKILGAEIGSVTINGQTWSKAILSPVISLDGFRLGLYLPIVYQTEMFNPSLWYKPSGNNEWSFGTDQDGLQNQIGDALSDFVLKIKFLELGRQGVDPFYLKVGSLKTMTIGHGTIMSNFANDQDFPAVRKVALNAGVTFGPVGLEGVTDDLAKPEVTGGRFAINVIGDQVALGFSGITDISVASTEPMLIVGGLDLQLFKLDLGVFRALAYADANVLSAYYGESKTANLKTIPAGFQLDTIFRDGELRSFGGEAGLMGKALIIDYRLAFQFEKGLYHNQIFRSNYYRTRSETLTGITNYLTDQGTAATDATSTLGVLGSAGFNLFGILDFEGAYRWPMSLTAGGKIETSADDSLKLVLTIPKGALPDFLKLSGNVSYERTKFVEGVINNTLFDANTVFGGEILYGVTSGVDLAIGIATVMEQGKVVPSVNLDTRIGF